jgi:hypothetical protein
MKKILLIIVAVLLTVFAMTLAIKGVCMPFIFWLALAAPVGIIVVHLGGGKNLF